MGSNYFLPRAKPPTQALLGILLKRLQENSAVGLPPIASLHADEVRFRGLDIISEAQRLRDLIYKTEKVTTMTFYGLQKPVAADGVCSYVRLGHLNARVYANTRGPGVETPTALSDCGERGSRTLAPPFCDG